MTDLPDRPASIHDETGLGPRGPWSFLREAAPGGFSASGLWLLAGWVLLAVGPAFLWATYLMDHTRIGSGWSALPAHWGEQLNAKDAVELFTRGKVHGLLGAGASGTLMLGVGLLLWASWKHQAESAGLQAKLGAWLGGLLEAILVGLPCLVIALIGSKILSYLGGLGIPALSWIAFVAGPLLGLSASAAWMTQWWLLRLNRLQRKGTAWPRHLGQSFLRLWSHPVQWAALLGGGAAFRLALHGAVLETAWRMGGGTAGRVAAFVGLEALAALAGGWILGWMLRATALYWRHDQAVRRTVAELEAAATATASEWEESR